MCFLRKIEEILISVHHIIEMVFIRRRRPLVRRRRPAMRRGRKMLRLRRNPRIHAPKKFVETYDQVTISSVPGGLSTGTGYNLKVALNQLTNPTSLANVFEQYCITGVKLTYIPTYNVSYLDADEGVQMPQIFFAENKFDPTNPTDESSMLQEDNCRIISASKRWSLYVSKPKPYLTQVGQPPNAAVQSQTGSRFITWLPLNETGADVDHLTARLWCQGNNTASTFTMGKIYAKVYYSLKEQH